MATTQVHLSKPEVVGDNPSNAATQYGGFGGVTVFSTTESAGTQVWAVAGTFANLLVTILTAPGVGKSWAFTLRVNGVDSALTVTISDTATTARDTTHSVTVAPGDRLTIKSVPTGTPAAISASVAAITIALEFTGTNTGESGYAGQTPTVSLSASAARYQGVFRLNNGWNTTATTSGSARSLVAAAGTITALYVLLNGAPGVGKNYTFAIYKNGTRQDGAGGTTDTRVVVADSATTGNATFALSVAPGDVLTLEALPSGTPTARAASAAVRFVATTDGQSQYCGCTSDTPSTSLTEYTRLNSASATVWFNGETDENSVRVLSGISSFSLSGFQMRADTAPGASKSYTFSLRRNATSPAGAPSVLLSGASATSGADLTGTLTVADGDVFNLRSVPAGTPTAAATQWGFIQGPPVSAAVERVDAYVWGPL